MKTKLLMVFAIFLSNQLMAQKVELSPTAGWLFTGSPSSNIDLKNNVIYGLSLTYMFKETMGIDLNYNYCSSTLRLRDNYYAPAYSSGTYSFDEGYITLGVVKTVALSNEQLVPYTRVGLGMMHVDVKAAGVEPQYKFAGTLEGGIKYFISDKVGIKASARLQSPFAGVGMYMGFGTGGASTGVSTYSYILQFDLSGGLVFRF
jgi:outer membrane protein W